MRLFNIFKNKNTSSEARPLANSKYAGLDKKVKEGTFKDRMDAIKALEGNRDEEAVRILIWLLQNGDSHSGEITKFDERAVAAGVLGKTGGELALRALEGARTVPGLEHDVDYAIAEIRRSQDAQALIEGLRTTPIPVLAVLTERKDECGVEYAVKLLDSSDISTVVSAARYLGVIRHVPAVDRLVKLLQQSEYIDIQHTAAVALGRIGGPKAKAVLLDALHHKSEWAVSGAVKGLAFMWANGEHDVLERIGDTKCGYGCSKDNQAEEDAQFEAVNSMLLSKYASPAAAVSGAVIINADKSTVTFKEKCDACGYVSSEQRTSTIPYKGKMLSYFHCPQCKNGQNVVIEGPK